MSPSGRQRPKPSGAFHVARTRDTVYVRVVGLGTQQNSATFDAFVAEMQKLDYRRFVCDLADCRGMDSTFMGVLAGLHGEVDGLVLVNPHAHCLAQLRSVGLDQILAIDEGRDGVPEGVVFAEVPAHETHPVERMKLIMRAHQELVRADRRNEEKFGAFLRDVLKQLGPSPEGVDGGGAPRDSLPRGGGRSPPWGTSPEGVDGGGAPRGSTPRGGGGPPGPTDPSGGPAGRSGQG